METREEFIERLKGKKLFYKRPDGVWILYTSKYDYTTAEKQRWIADELDRLNEESERDRQKLIAEWKDKRAVDTEATAQVVTDG